MSNKLTIGKGINAGLRAAMEHDPKVLVMGEDVGRLGGVFRVTDGLSKDFGADRVIDTPLAESGIVGTAIGMAMRGYRPVVESVKRTGRLVVTHEATLTGGPGAEIAARVTEECFYHLESPVIRVAAFDTPYPQSRLEEHYLPDLDRVLDGVDRAFAY